MAWNFSQFLLKTHWWKPQLLVRYGFDWWAYELLTLLAGGLQSETQLAAHVAATTASDWAFLVVRGAPKAATAMVGAAMGQKDISRVREVAGYGSW